MIDEHDRRLYAKRLPNRLRAVLSALAPFKHNLAEVVLESSFNWYWLGVGLPSMATRYI
jgi:transposase